MTESAQEPRLGLSAYAGPDAAYWLGQAGFWIDLGGQRLLIDPYLSDSLARKYAGTIFPHIRMMPPPVTPEQLPKPDAVLVTHAHSDHMDGDTLSVLAARFGALLFIVPAAEEQTARKRIGPKARLALVDSGDHVSVGAVSISVFPAAHETRKRDQAGRDHYLGYGISCAGKRLYHSGDCVPFEDLETLVRAYRPDLAFLPINGRDAERAANGVPGNMTLDEAIALCQACQIARLVPHHFGMFAFNTADALALARAECHSAPPTLQLPSPLSPIPL